MEITSEDLLFFASLDMLFEVKGVSIARSLPLLEAARADTISAGTAGESDVRLEVDDCMDACTTGETRCADSATTLPLLGPATGGAGLLLASSSSISISASPRLSSGSLFEMAGNLAVSNLLRAAGAVGGTSFAGMLILFRVEFAAAKLVLLEWSLEPPAGDAFCTLLTWSACA